MTNRVTKQCQCTNAYVKQGRNYQRLYYNHSLSCNDSFDYLMIHLMHLMFSVIFKLSLSTYRVLLDAILVHSCSLFRCCLSVCHLRLVFSFMQLIIRPIAIAYSVVHYKTVSVSVCPSVGTLPVAFLD